MNDIGDNQNPLSPQVETAMQNTSESFMDLRSAINKSHYGKPTDIKTAVNRLLASVMDMVEVVE